MDIDAAGGAVTAGLVGGAIEKPTGHAGEAHSTCTDCGEPVSGKFCSNCGQPTHVHRSLLHLGEEVLHGVMHFDTRAWRTLPLLVFNAGRLTREWVQGRRTRYVSPLAMFLFTVFLMFFILSFGGGGFINASSPSTPEQRAEAEAALAAARAELQALEAADAAGEPPPPGELQAQRGVVTGLEAVLRRSEGASLEARSDGLTPGSWQADLADARHSGRLQVNTGNAGFDKAIRKKLGNPDLALYKIQQTLYKFAFLLVPISIPFVALLFLWKRGFTWYDHGVFVLYSLTFMALLFMATGWISRIPVVGPALAGLMWLAPPVHMFAQLKGAYGLGVFSALWRTIALLMFCVLAVSIFLLAIILLGLTG